MNVKDGGFAVPGDAGRTRQALVDQYVAAFRQVETGAIDKATATLRALSANVSAQVVTDQRAAITALLDGQLAKLA